MSNFYHTSTSPAFFLSCRVVIPLKGRMKEILLYLTGVYEMISDDIPAGSELPASSAEWVGCSGAVVDHINTRTTQADPPTDTAVFRYLPALKR